MRRRSVLSALAVLMVLASAALQRPLSPTLAQTGGGYDLDWSVFGSAGDQFVTGGSYQLGFTLGQSPSPLVSSGGGYQIVQGYSAGADSPPTAVTLASFTAAATHDAIVLEWETASELDNLGFNLYRQAADGELLRLNAALIFSENAGGLVGAAYSWLDEVSESGSAQPGVYWLEAVDAQGRTTRYGPVSACR
jgi:hypothetical protein